MTTIYNKRISSNTIFFRRCPNGTFADTAQLNEVVHWMNEEVWAGAGRTMLRRVKKSYRRFDNSCPL